MPVYRFEIGRDDPLWITAYDERGAIALASAHLEASTLDEGAIIQIKHDADDALILRATAGQWSRAAGITLKSERCERCDDSGWVCEAHDDRPWLSDVGDPHCGAPGVPCPACNPSGGPDDPPDDSRILSRPTPPTP